MTPTERPMDFTEAEYRRLLKVAKEKRPFVRLAEYQTPGPACIWRHDVDFSIHRACRIGEIEAEEGLSSIYFLHLHNTFYSLLEREIADLVNRLLDLGHEIGLHFDPGFYAEGKAQLSKLLRAEKKMLTETFQTEINAFSIHNPDTCADRTGMEREQIEGMVNASTSEFRQSYSYCSDSNGYWRFRPLNEIIEDVTVERIYVLTHPGWWVPEPMSPRARITRCIEGRAAKTAVIYDRLLTDCGRRNID